MKTHRHQVFIHWGDTDPAKIVFYPNYFVWMDQSTFHLFDSVGLNWNILMERYNVPGVPINAIDDFGFTPLMYAATIDHGDTAVLEALLAAGARRDIRNDAGRTALQQAVRLRHPGVAKVLNRR